MSFKVTIKDNTEALFTKLRGSTPQISAYMAISAAATFEKGMVQTIKKNKNIFEGDLIKSIKTKISSTSGNPKVVVGSFDVDYAKYIEYGRPPGVSFSRKEFGKLMKWVSRKLGKSPPDNMRIAIAIRRNLTKSGRDAQPFVRTVAESYLNPFRHKFNDKFNEFVRTLQV